MVEKILLIFSITLLTWGCVNDNRREVKVTKKEQFIQGFSDERTVENVISPKEAVSGAIESAQTDHANLTTEIIEENYEWKSSNIGAVELVEDFSSPTRKEEPYFYYINLVMPDGKILIDALVNGMDNTDNAGKIGIISIVGRNREFNSSTRTKEEAYEYLEKKLFLKKDEQYEIKAILPSDAGINIFDWGWAIKTESKYSVSKPNSQEVESNLFFINAYNYTLSSKSSEDMVECFENKADIAILEDDVFDEELRKNGKMNAANISMVESVY